MVSSPSVPLHVVGADPMTTATAMIAIEIGAVNASV